MYNSNLTIQNMNNIIFQFNDSVSPQSIQSSNNNLRTSVNSSTELTCNGFIVACAWIEITSDK